MKTAMTFSMNRSLRRLLLRFGFENGKHYGITVSENEFDNEHLQILFLGKSIKGRISGRLVYCDAFYDADGNLL